MLLSRKDFLKLSGASVGTGVALSLLTNRILTAAAKESTPENTGTKAKGVLYDGTLCIGCKTCERTCKTVNNLPATDPLIKPSDKNQPRLTAYTFTRIGTTEIADAGKVRPVFIKFQCMHCVHPACAEACIVGALKKRPDGPVTYDKTKCIGCRYCQVACPFGVPNFQWDKPLPWIQKCSFCADRQDAGLKPGCVETCPTGALKFGYREDLLAEARQRIAATPGRYIDYIYGEKEVGGTSWLYLSPVSFEQLGFAKHSLEPVPINAARAMGAVPPVLLGVAAAMTGIYWLTKRRQQLNQVSSGVEEKEAELKQKGAKQ
jgi:formate dehydrogenase iron-sulfur subunit